MAKEKDKATPEDIGARLSEQEAEPTAVTPDAPRASEPAPAFDITKLSTDQLQTLAEQLQYVPRRQRARGNMIIKLRTMSGKIIIDIGTCYMKTVTDTKTNTTAEVPMLPVKFLGAATDDFEDVVWRDFMNADQIKCEVVKQTQEPDRIVEGEVVSKASGQLVEMEVKIIRHFFEVKLPEGTTPATIVLPEHVINA